MKTTSLSALALVLLASTAHADTPADGAAPAPAPPPTAAPAPAPAPVPREVPPPAPRDHIPRLHIAASAGYNSPSGIVGLEADYRLHRYASVGLAGGIGLWGTRISPTVKLEIPFDRYTGIFLEGALAINTGGSGHTTTNGMREEFEQGIVPAASIAVGGRVKRWGPFWTGAKVGANFALRSKAYSIMGGGEGTDVTRVLLEAAYPGGLLVSWMAGAAF